MKSIGMICLLLSCGFIQQAQAACHGFENGTRTNNHNLQYNDGQYYNYNTGCPDLSVEGWDGSKQNASLKTGFFGFRDGWPQTNFPGRSQAAVATLDACFNMGHETTDAITDTLTCYYKCDSATLNVACDSNTSNALGDCWNRCDAVNWSEKL